MVGIAEGKESLCCLHRRRSWNHGGGEQRSLLAKGRSIGLNISLPFEQFPNKYISSELNFEFHYFFMRKYWFMYLGKALVAFPGGFGTLDELMELLTSASNKKNQKENDSNSLWEKILGAYLKFPS